MTGGSNERRARSPQSFLVSLVILFGVTICFVVGEWRILAPFSRFLSQSADKYAAEIMPAKVVRSVAQKTAKVVMEEDYEVEEEIEEMKTTPTQPLTQSAVVKTNESQPMAARQGRENVAQQSANHLKVSAAVPKAQYTSSEEDTFDRIVLLGERHSGTFLMTKTLEECFPDIEVSDFLVRSKHWFQPTPDFVVSTTRQYLKNDITEEEGLDMFEIHNQWPNIAALEDPKANAFKRTLLIVMVRNPYDWLESMRLQPFHWTKHVSLFRLPNAPVLDAIGNPWYGFNSTSWTDFVKTNMTFVEGDVQQTRLCQNGFLNGTVTPCLKSKATTYPEEVKADYPNNVNEAPDLLPLKVHDPIYELDPNGKPYANPLALRAAKIQNFLDIPNNWDLGSFLTVQLEEVNVRGYSFLLEQVGKIVRQEPACEAEPPKNLPGRGLDREWQEWITKNADWETERKIGYEPRPLIQHIALLGERHSGTTYMTNVLANCFPKLHVIDSFGRYKHWFQPTPEYMLNATMTVLKEPALPIELPLIRRKWSRLMPRRRPKDAFKDTLVVAMFRNPYDWMEAMRESPHHWPNHLELVRKEDGEYRMQPHNWQKFVSADMKMAGNDTERSPICQNGFALGSVSPCLIGKDLYPDVVKKDFASNLSAAPDHLPFNADDPLYELDENGKPFANPLELRTAKIKALLDLQNRWNLGGFVTVQHEDINEKGPLFFINIVSRLVGMKSECTPDPARRQPRKQLVRDWADWITKNADWETEKEIGYEPRVGTPPMKSQQGM